MDDGEYEAIDFLEDSSRPPPLPPPLKHAGMQALYSEHQ